MNGNPCLYIVFVPVYNIENRSYLPSKMAQIVFKSFFYMKLSAILFI